MNNEELMNRSFFRKLSEGRTYLLKPVKVVDYQEAWEITHEFSDFEIQSIYLMEKTGEKISFKEAYRLRWLEMAQKDSKGRYWLVSSKAIRTPLWKWAKERGYWIKFEENDIFLQNIKNIV